ARPTPRASRASCRGPSGSASDLRYHPPGSPSRSRPAGAEPTGGRMRHPFAHMMAGGALGALIVVLTMASAEGDTRGPARPTLGRIERLDARLDAVIAPGAAMEVIANGFDWTEGPLWVRADGGYLLFSDI